MKKTIVFLSCLLAFAFVAFAQRAGEVKNGYVDAVTEMDRAEKIEQERTKTQEINVPAGFNAFKDKKYMDDNIAKAGGTIRIEYSPLYDEVRIYYTCMMTQYDRGEAMNVVLAVLQDFTIMTEYTNSSGDVYRKDKYYRYKYLTPDKEKYFKNERGFRMAQYISYLKFDK